VQQRVLSGMRLSDTAKPLGGTTPKLAFAGERGGQALI
jgi:hypothetical protein